MDKIELIVTGFPKCGTTAFCRYLNASNNINHILFPKNNAQEAPFFKTEKDLKVYEDIVEKSRFRCNSHKFAAYIFSKKLLNTIKTHSADAKIVILTRNITNALFSWHNMHRNIALSKPQVAHFVNKTAESKQFYSNCTVDEYFQEYAKDKLNYGRHIKKTLGVFSEDNIFHTTQELLFKNPNMVFDKLIEFLGIDIEVNFEEYNKNNSRRKRPYGDKAEKKINDFTASEISKYESELSLISSQLKWGIS